MHLVVARARMAGKGRGFTKSVKGSEGDGCEEWFTVAG
jgi:hypothetical protein